MLQIATTLKKKKNPKLWGATSRSKRSLAFQKKMDQIYQQGQREGWGISRILTTIAQHIPASEKKNLPKDLAMDPDKHLYGKKK